jgi:hypothetical protein
LNVPSFKELDQEEIWKILNATDEKGNKLHQDVLSPLLETEDRHFKNSPCPKCGDYSGSPTIDPMRPFTPDYPLPNKILRCTICETEWDPYTRLIRRATTDGPV